jgi:hypothetical protein
MFNIIEDDKENMYVFQKLNKAYYSHFQLTDYIKM